MVPESSCGAPRSAFGAIALASAAALSGVVFAQDVQLGRVVVEAEGASAIDERLQSPFAVIVLDRDEIDRYQDQTVGQILRRVVGLSFSGPPGVVKDIRVRGLDKGFTQILIDGEPVLGVAGNEQLQLDRLPADAIERIEILRNPTADVELAGIGGTINIILRRAPRERVRNLRLGVGRQGGGSLGEVGLTAGDRQGDVAWLLSVQAQRRVERLADERRTFGADGALRQRQTEDKPADIDEFTLAPRLTWMPDGPWRFELDPFFSQTREVKSKQARLFAASGEFNRLTEDEEKKLRRLARVRSGITHTTAEGHQTRLRLSFQDGVEDKDSSTLERNADGGLRKQETENARTAEREWGTRLLHDRVLRDDLVWRSGLEGRWRSRDQTTAKRQIVPAPKNDPTGPERSAQRERYAAVFSDLSWEAGRHALTPGLRIENLVQEVREIEGARNDFTAINPSLHYRFSPLDRWVLRASVARSIRPPKLGDISPIVDEKDGDVFKPDKVGNPKLREESALGTELGVEYRLGRGGLVGFNLFDRRVRDLIEKVVRFDADRERFIERPENVGRARFYGAELELRWVDAFAVEGLTVSGNYARLNSRVRDGASGQTRRVKDQPLFTSNVGFDYAATPRLAFGASYNHLSATVEAAAPDNQFRSKREAAKRLLDAYVRFRINDT